MKKTVWLHNIRSVHNVGSIFRTADAAGVTHIYLSGYTPLPVDRFGRARSDMAKVAIGAEKFVSWQQLDDPKDFFSRQEHILMVGVEQDVRSQNIFDYTPDLHHKKEILIVMGEEVSGMEPWQREQCHDLVEIPMLGEKESLNVSVAFGVAAYQLLKNIK